MAFGATVIGENLSAEGNTESLKLNTLMAK